MCAQLKIILGLSFAGGRLEKEVKWRAASTSFALRLIYSAFNESGLMLFGAAGAENYQSVVLRESVLNAGSGGGGGEVHIGISHHL